ncbi:Hypothetical protein A7982_05509 [Minicystis rosea]|nr:Hypothetical protein A7982_05509 [Minicystis rosea]
MMKPARSECPRMARTGHMDARNSPSARRVFDAGASSLVTMYLFMAPERDGHLRIVDEPIANRASARADADRALRRVVGATVKLPRDAAWSTLDRDASNGAPW